MNKYTLSDNANDYLDFFLKEDYDRDLGMYATIYEQVREATQGPYQDPQEILGPSTNQYN
jgi:hypothetical protein